MEPVAIRVENAVRKVIAQRPQGVLSENLYLAVSRHISRPQFETMIARLIRRGLIAENGRGRFVPTPKTEFKL